MVVSNPCPARISSKGGSGEVVEGTGGVVRKQPSLSRISSEGE